MRWVEKKHLHGDRRFVRRFALFPTRMECRTLVWLERYWVKQWWMQRTKYDELKQKYVVAGGEWRFEHRTLKKEE